MFTSYTELYQWLVDQKPIIYKNKTYKPALGRYPLSLDAPLHEYTKGEVK